MSEFDLMELSNKSAERNILGTLLTDSDDIRKREHLPSVSYFTSEYDRIIMQAIQNAVEGDYEAINIATVYEEVKKMNEDIPVSYLTSLTLCDSSWSYMNDLRIIKQLAEKRELYESMQEASQKLIEGENASVVAQNIEETIREIGRKNTDDITDDIQDVAFDFFEKLNEEDKKGLEFGFKILDENTGGLYPHEFTIIGAKSGVGKTTLALNIAKNVLVQKEDAKVLIITREMPRTQIFMRFITSHTGIPASKIKNKNLTEQEYKKIMEAMEVMTGYKNLMINDKVRTIEEIKDLARKYKPDLMIVDYLQLVGVESKKIDNREREVAHISKELRNITLELETHVIALTQLNDSYTGMPAGEKAVRESKAIYHDASNVIYLHIPTSETEIENIVRDKETCEQMIRRNNTNDFLRHYVISLDKCRDGSKARTVLNYVGAFLKFAEGWK